jgi:adenosylhomocysteine nucleosidase
MARLLICLLILITACRPGEKSIRKVIVISANAEWKVIKDIYQNENFQKSPWGEYFEKKLTVSGAAEEVIFFHEGWGKVAAAGGTQYVIDRWNPEYLVNIGTCGGFEGKINRYEIVLVDSAVIYDIQEAMGDSQEAIDDYRTKLDMSWLGAELPTPVIRTVMVSGDRDLVPAELPMLASNYNAIVGDWETGAIAYTCFRNHKRVLILRGVTDLVNEQRGEAYPNLSVFISGTDTVMRKLVKDLPLWLAKCK